MKLSFIKVENIQTTLWQKKKPLESITFKVYIGMKMWNNLQMIQLDIKLFGQYIYIKLQVTEFFFNSHGRA